MSNNQLGPSRIARSMSTGTDNLLDMTSLTNWADVLPMEKGSHNSAKIIIPVEPTDDDPFDKANFPRRLEASITACRELGKSSLWIDVPMSRASRIEDMHALGLSFHHAEGTHAFLYLWLNDHFDSKIPLFATHNIGVGGLVVNSRDEILCVRELRNNYRPWKTPTGLSNLGEQLDDAAEREVLEETGIQTKFHSILGFRQTHGMSHGRSDLFFVCRLDPVEEIVNGTALIPEPVAQACEISAAAWVPLQEFRDMVNGPDPHPMMQHVLDVYDSGLRIDSTIVASIVPGRQPSALFFPAGSNTCSSNA
jgi:ADP-ribose pyrophosphatase YjhB (NUDIX family)